MRPKTLTKRSLAATCYCGAEFFFYKREENNGLAKYCSLRCRNDSPTRIKKSIETSKKNTAIRHEQEKAAKRLRCRRCSELKPKDDFVKDKTRPHGYFPWCKLCHSLKQKAYNTFVVPEAELTGDGACLTCRRPLGGDAHFNRLYCSAKCKLRLQRLKLFGLTPDDFRKLTVSGKCPLCNCNVNRWAIDHDHETGETMSPVCQRCNQYLLVGSKHRLAVAKALVEYLTESPVRKMFGERRYVGKQTSSNIHRMWLWTGKEPNEQHSSE